MKTTVLWCCLVSAAAAFNFGVLATSYTVGHAEKPRDPPPAGDQFDEGPVLVRLPGASTTNVRFIF